MKWLKNRQNLQANNVKSKQFLKRCVIFAAMQIFRQRYIRLVTIAIAGLAFVNLTFFMAELSLIKTDRNKPLIEQLQKFLSTSVNEEDPDAANESGSSKEIEDVILFHIPTFSRLALITNSRLEVAYSIQGLHPGYAKVHTPPPDSFHI
jgi:hypothetical protein